MSQMIREMKSLDSRGRRSGSTARARKCHQLGTEDALVRKCSAELLLHVARSARQADIDTASGRVACVDALCEVRDVLHAQVTAAVVNTTLDKEGVALRSGVDCVVRRWACKFCCGC
jgi:hypothetical protein